MGTSQKTFLTVIITACAWAPLSLAHKNHAHTAHKEPTHSEVPTFKRINIAYTSQIKSIFEKKCFDCHSNQTQFPWYSDLPVAKTVIQSDIQEAKKHLDFSNGFPFQGHGSPKEDLEAILKSVTTGSMPPMKYRLLHWGSKVTDDEIKTIRQWVEDSKKLL